MLFLFEVKAASDFRVRPDFAVCHRLEGLQGKITGMISIRVLTEGLPSANADLMLDSLFEDADALKGEDDS